MSLTIDQEDYRDVTVFSLSGRLTLGEECALLQKRMLDSLTNGRRKFVLIFSAVTYVDSAGLGQLVKAYVMTSNGNGELVLVGVTKRVADVLAITKLLSVFRTFDDLPAALSYFAANNETP